MTRGLCLTTLVLAITLTGALAADKQYGPGVTDDAVKIGQTMPFSGPASGYASVGLTEQAYYKLINERGGVNGRKIELISLDDGYSPPKTVEQTRRLVESDNVLAIVGALGTAPNTAIHKYLESKKVPHIFISSGATKWGDPKHFPWTMGWQPNYQIEGRIYAAYILQNKPDGKIGVLYQDDDFGKDYLKGLTDGLGDKGASMVVVKASYETTDPTVDSQVVDMQAKGVDVFVNTAIPKFAAQAIRKAAEIEWKPLHILSSIGSSIGATLKPAGLEHCRGIVTDLYLKDSTDPKWQDDPGFKDWSSFMDKYLPGADKSDGGYIAGSQLAATLVQVLKQCGDELTRENVVKQAANLHDFTVPMLLPGITINTSPTDFAPLKQVQMARFEGEHWESFGPLLAGAVG